MHLNPLLQLLEH